MTRTTRKLFNARTGKVDPSCILVAGTLLQTPQGYTTEEMKALILSLVMVVFGFGQFACACEALSSHPAKTAETTRVHHHGHTVMALMSDVRHAVPLSHRHDSDSDHCQQTAWASNGTTSGPTVALPNANRVVMPAPRAALAFIVAVVTSDFPRTWLDPPIRTPISLKVKTLN